ncbi:hypothetical protein AAG906_023134 [Vitis piasezkii]
MANNNVFIQLLFLIITSSGFLFHEIIKVGSCQGDHQRGCIDTEKVALLKFKQGLTDPSGRLSSWVGEDCCKWRGVVCNNRSGHVIKLTLRYLDGDGTEGELGGKISPALLDLKYLNYLDLSMNNFGGIPIPEFIGSLEKLRYLNLSGASFGGPIPPQLGNLSSLHYLDLKEYFDESSQDDLHWISGLTSLRHLNLGGVDLSQAAAYWLQAVSKISTLLEPSSSLPFSSLITSLSVIDLSNNGFNSTIPHWLFQMRNLVYLDLSSNNLRGSILDSFANRTSIERLRNMGKRFEWEITELIDVLSGCNSSWLETLDLGFNDLGGFLPNSLGKLHNLKSLWLWDNSFVGSIPSSIGNLSYLEELYLSDNPMNGTIPETLGGLSKLVAIELSENPLTGVVTEAHFSNLTSLKEFSNYRVTPRVSLVFNISPEWIPPFKLSLLRIRSCQMGPKFPAWLRNQTELTSVVLSNAGISGTIPEWFWKLDLHLDELDIGSNNLGGRVPNSMKFLPGATVDLEENNFQGPLPLWSSNVTRLNLYDNFFSGPIPQELGERMSMLTDLDLSWNALNGTIPLSFGKLTNLLTLVISNNHLSGGIPEFWNGLPDLYVLDMNNNNLSGELPSSMGSLRFVRFLMISNNHLSGEIPSALQNCTAIHTLDLGGNRFSGNVPAWIGERMPNLLILRLRSNLFHGSIPSQLCTLSSLHILDLGENNFGMVSEIDSQRYEAELMVWRKGREDLYKSILYLVNSMDLSNNNLCGEVPEGVTNLSRLGTLNLSINHLTGKIPDNIGSLQGLETLDLSRNQLSGVIPPGMASLTSLNHLNLSYNNLSGRIPTGNQLQTLDDPSIYENNPALCGPPTTAKCPGDDQRPKTRSGDNVEDENENGDGFEMKWFYVSMGPGFAVGFWGVCVTLIVKNSWRHAYFRLVYDVKEWLLMVISLNVARLRRKLNLGCSDCHHHRAACIETERVALLKFKQGLTDPSHRFSSWVGEECCKWRGLVCNNRIGHVIKLNLRSLNDDGTDGKLGGEISLSLVDLKYLNYFLEIFCAFHTYNFCCSSTYMANINASIHFLLLIFLSSTFLHLETVKLGSCNGVLNVSCTEIERKALVDFKQGLTDPSGRLSSWVGLDCCRWRGVVCSQRAPQVIKLKLRNRYRCFWDYYGAAHAFGGEISHSLLDLKYLRYLDLSMNYFGGLKIPKFIGSFKKLRYLNLSGASFGGTIPPHLGNLSSLLYLDLNSYSLESVENDLHWLSGLSSLRHLNLGNIDFSKAAAYWHRAVSSLSSLLELRLPGCGLSSLPDLSLPFGNVTSLSMLDLSNNGFNSSIPHWLFNFSSLAYLDLNSNNLQGRNLGKLCNLRTLKLSFNSISGEITGFMDGLSECVNGSSLESLDLGFNDKLGGFLPDALGHLKNLKSLRLWSNSFVGSIPNSIGNLSSLKEFYISENQMNGIIPESVGQLSALVAVDLSENPWVGVITESHFSNLTNLTELAIKKVSPNVTLAFNVSSKWIPPFKLNYLELRTCQLGPKFPAWLRNQNQLKTLVLNNARISDTIPDWFWKLDLQLDSNRFHGPIPHFSSNLSSLYLRDNLFSGPIPRDVGKTMPWLTNFDVSWNSLNGTIPLSIGKITVATNFQGKFLLHCRIARSWILEKLPPRFLEAHPRGIKCLQFFLTSLLTMNSYYKF